MKLLTFAEQIESLIDSGELKFETKERLEAQDTCDSLLFKFEEFEISFDIYYSTIVTQPEERQTYWHPGCPAEYEVDSLELEGSYISLYIIDTAEDYSVELPEKVRKKIEEQVLDSIGVY